MAGFFVAPFSPLSVTYVDLHACFGGIARGVLDHGGDVMAAASGFADVPVVAQGSRAGAADRDIVLG